MTTVFDLMLAQSTSNVDAGFTAFFMIIWFVMMLFGMVLTIGAVALMVYCIIDIVKRQFESENEKIIWVLVVIFASLIGGLIYVLWGRKRGTIDANSS